MEVAYRAFEIGDRKVRPQALGEMELGVSALPQQEIAQSLLTAGTDQQIHIRYWRAVEVAFALEIAPRSVGTLLARAERAFVTEYEAGQTAERFNGIRYEK